MTKFKNISDNDLSIENVGIVKSGEVVELPDDFNNANFKVVINSKSEKSEQDKTNKHK